jgi:dienelactone hydrolase
MTSATGISSVSVGGNFDCGHRSASSATGLTCKRSISDDPETAQAALEIDDLSRREFLWFAGSLGGVLASASAAEIGDFDPQAWLRSRNLGKLTVRTPQSDKPLQPLIAKTLSEWEKERALYLQALRELIGPWPQTRPRLDPVVLEQKEFEKFTRFKVSFCSIPSAAEHASQIRSWLFVPKDRPAPRPAVITLHQTLPQGKDEPAGIKASLPWMTHATYFAERGYITLAPDAIGYGERTAGGTARTGFELADASPILDRHPEMTLLGLMLYDVTRCVDYLQSRADVDRGRIGVLGHSQGGFLVNIVLGLELRLRVGVASCGYGLFRKDELFPDRWVAKNSAYLPRLSLYANDRNALPIDFLQIMALSAPRSHLVQTALGDTIWTIPAVADNAFVMKELKRVRSFYGKEAEAGFISVEPGGGDLEKNHGWYPECQKAADALLEKVLAP